MRNLKIPAPTGDWNRRRFLGTAGVSALMAALTPACALKNSLRAKPEPETQPRPAIRVYPDLPPAVVSVVGVKDSIAAAVREAVAAAGGIAEIEKGQRVMIKPNLCGPALGARYPGRITTHPEVVRAVIRLVKERGAIPIVGERAMFMTETAFVSSGIAKICREEGAIAFPWTRAEYVWFHPGRRHWSRGFRVPRELLAADHFINVPLLKNHGVQGAEFTCCLKSFVGVCHPEDRHQAGPDNLHLPDISEKIAELNLCARPTINIVDAMEIMVAGGPDGLKKDRLWARPRLILAGKDRVAADSLALAVLKCHGAELKVDLPYVTKSVWDQTQIYYAGELGLGQAEPAHITLHDLQAPRFDEIRDHWS